MPRFTSIDDIIKHVRGKFPQMVFVGADYSISDLIADLEQIDREAAENVNRLTERVADLVMIETTDGLRDEI